MISALLCVAIQQSSNFVTIPAGKHTVGKSDRIANPLRSIRLKTFEISKFETTNSEFTKFVSATRYVTDAEKLKNAMVFEPGLKEFRWIHDPTATWRFPNGKSRGGILGKEDHPVTTISFNDALQYCKWAKVRLPTLDEWEVACRAGTRSLYFFGNDINDAKDYANIWHGRNHLKSDVSDGFELTSPVGSFLPNQFGLYDTYGNVFEFCSGSLKGDRSKRVVHARGGSWWCSKYSCAFFNSVDIGKVDIKASFSNQGFRIARNITR